MRTGTRTTPESNVEAEAWAQRDEDGYDEDEDVSPMR